MSRCIPLPANTLLVINNCYGCPHRDWQDRKQVCGKMKGNNALSDKMLDAEPPTWCPLQMLHPIKVMQCPYGHGPVDARSLYCCRRCGWDAHFKG